jgi:hypothetical protein
MKTFFGLNQSRSSARTVKVAADNSQLLADDEEAKSNLMDLETAVDAHNNGQLSSNRNSSQLINNSVSST